MEWIEALRGTVVGLDTAPVSEAVAEDAARIRAHHGLRTPDAIQLATALHSGETAFLTDDGRLSALASLKMLVLNQIATRGS